eukprot:5501405-Amphidinium_carterae.1
MQKSQIVNVKRQSHQSLPSNAAFSQPYALQNRAEGATTAQSSGLLQIESLVANAGPPCSFTSVLHGSMAIWMHGQRCTREGLEGRPVEKCPRVSS